MADTTLPGLFDSGDHASRPAANAVGSGALYSCTTHSLVYQSDGSAWTTWATLGGGAVAADDVSIADSGGYFTGTDVEAALQELGAGGGGGGLTQAYVGYNTIGATGVAPTDFDHVLQKITLANDCLMTDIQLYIKQGSANQQGDWGPLLYTDNAGKPDLLLSAPKLYQAGNNWNLYQVSGVAGDARWFSLPIGRWLAAGDYWIGFHWNYQGAQWLVYYDATGTGYKWTSGGNAFLTDAPDTSGTVYTLTAQTRTYSIRANTIR